MQDSHGQHIPRETIHIRRHVFIRDGGCYEKLTVRNFSDKPCSVDIALSFDADFRDIFEIRGMRREARGQISYPYREGHIYYVQKYIGLDSVERCLQITAAPEPDH